MIVFMDHCTSKLSAPPSLARTIRAAARADDARMFRAAARRLMRTLPAWETMEVDAAITGVRVFLPRDFVDGEIEKLRRF